MDIPKYSAPLGWHGDYPTFEEAATRCEAGYQGNHIPEKKFQRTQSIASASPSTMVDPNTLRSFFLLESGAQRLQRVLDIGGEMGVHYFRLKRYLNARNLEWKLNWDVLEQPSVAAFAQSKKDFFAATSLSFHSDSKGLENKIFDLVHTKGCLQYLSNPLDFIKEAARLSKGHILIDNLPVTNTENDHFCIQHVSADLYAARLPCRFFSVPKLMKMFEEADLELVAQYPCPEDGIFLNQIKMMNFGFVLNSRK
jgi:putative methyltransferase (TIGR04325 family)